MTTLESLRAEIDRADEQMMLLFCRRMELSRLIGREKKALGMAVIDPGREAVVRENARARAGEALAPYAAEMYDTLLRVSRAYQAASVRE